MTFKKLIRDILRNKALFISCFLVILIALTGYISLSESSFYLNEAINNFYLKSNMADLFVNTSLSNKSIDNILQVKGVSQVNSRLIIPANYSNKNMTIYSCNSLNQKRINHPVISEGSNISRDNEIILNNGFARYNKINIGDTFCIKVQNKTFNFKVVGYFVSPEFLYSASPSKSNGKTGFAFISPQASYNILNEKIEYNQILIKTDSTADINKIIDYLKLNYNIKSIVKLNESQEYIHGNNTIRSLSIMSNIMAIIFYIAALFLIMLVIKKIVEKQQKEIGLLKTFGFTSFRIVRYFLCLGSIVALLACIIGIPCGIIIAKCVYILFKNDLVLQYSENSLLTNWSNVIIVSIIVIASCLIVSFIQTIRIFKYEPVKSINEVKSIIVKHSKLEKFKHWNKLPCIMRMILRNLTINRKKNIIVLFGLCMSFVFISLVFGINITNSQYVNSVMPSINNYDISADVVGNSLADNQITDFKRTSQISDVEGIGLLDVKMKSSTNELVNKICVLPSNNRMIRIYDTSHHSINVPVNGIVINESIAKYLNLHLTDKIQVEFNYGGNKTLRITGFCKQYYGYACFISAKQYKELFYDNNYIKKLLFKADENALNKAVLSLKSEPKINNITNMKDYYADYIENNKTTELTVQFIALIGIIISIILFTSCMTINFSDRKIDLNILKLLGFSNLDLEASIIGEYAILSIPCILIGIVMSIILYRFVIQISTIDKSVEISLMIPTSSFIYSMIGLIISLILSSLFIYKKINVLNNIEIIKMY